LTLSLCLLSVIISSSYVLPEVNAFASGDNKKGDASTRPVARLITTISSVPRRAASPAPSSPSRPATRDVMRVTAPSFAAAATSVERRAFDLINEQRIASGEQAFVWDADLTRMARLHSEHMLEQNFFDHVGPDGKDMLARAHACEIYGWRVLGENIAFNQGFDDPAAFAVERWMRSSKHRTNILNAQFSRSGLGVALARDGRIFFTQVFAAR
jgi:uncharacterized protein YkwD